MKTPRKIVTSPASDPRRSVYARLLSSAFFLVCIVILGATAYYQLGDGRWSFFDCVYMTVITLSTVGFGETLQGMNDVPEARAVTLILIVIGSGTLLYFLSNLTALVVEGDLQGILRARRMQRRIDQLEQHIVVCGAGNTGEHVIGELIDAGVSFVVIDQNEERVRVLGEDLGSEILHVIGDATDDHSLERAGVERARGVIAALTTDKDNLFVTISVKHLNPRARIVAKSIDGSTNPKLRRAGAHAIVSPNYIGGLRLVSEMIRPQAVQFLDRLLREDNKLRIEDVEVPASANIVGHTLADCSIRQTGALVVAIRTAQGRYVYNPGPEVQLEAGSHLIVIAHAEDLLRLREAMDKNELLRD
ncbi:MAG: potassium channel protein [Myxococcota bacterium]